MQQLKIKKSSKTTCCVTKKKKKMLCIQHTIHGTMKQSFDQDNLLLVIIC
jgi:hypothetical protein